MILLAAAGLGVADADFFLLCSGSSPTMDALHAASNSRGGTEAAVQQSAKL